MADSDIGLGTGGEGGGGSAARIFDVFADGEAPYAGIRARYGGADADWSARGVAVVPAVKSKALVPISGSMVNGWDITFKPGFLSGEEEGNSWKVIRRERTDAVAEIPAVAASLQWRVRGSGQTITITAAVAGAAGNNIGVKASRGTTRSTEYAVSRAGTRFDILWGTDGLSMSQLLREANAYYSRIVFSLNSGATGNSVNLGLPSNGVGYAFMTGGADAIPAVPAEPISFGFDAVAEEITVSIKATDTLAAIRGSNEFRTVFSPFAEATVVGTVDEATATFAIPANDPGIVFAGGKNGNPLGVEIDPLLNTIDIRYNPATHTLSDIFRVMRAAGVSPEYRGGGAAANTPEALGWVRSIGPLTAASPGTGTTTASALTAAQIKQRYESNANTNAFTNPLKTKLDGVDAGAADDQSGAEIKAAYEGEADTNAYTNDEKAKLGGVAAGATALAISDVLAKILKGVGIEIDRTTTPGEISVSSTGGALPVVYLGRPTTVADGALTFAKPTGYPATGRYPVGTLLSFISGYFTPFENSNTNLRVIIGTDSYTFEDVNTGSLYYRDLVTDTAHLLVATGSGTLQLLAPMKAAAATSTTTTAIPDNSITPAQLKANSAAAKAAMTKRLGAAALLGATFTGLVKGIVPTVAEDFVTLGYFMAHRNVSPITDDLYFGTSDDAVPIGSELDVPGVTSTGTIPAYVGSKHLLIARLATESDILVVTFSDDASNLNQIGAFTKYPTTVRPTGEMEDFDVWVSNKLLEQTNELIITVS